MLRLRTTVVLSVLALIVGIAGTDWLSGRSTDEPLAMPLTVAKRASPTRRALAFTTHGHGLSEASRLRRMRTGPTASAPRQPDAYDRAPSVTAPPELVPLDMPTVRDVAYDKLRGHLDGRVVLRVSIDGDGQVTAASVAESSGDAVLDVHALRSVRFWRFAVPLDHPDGLSADLPMRFSSHDEPIASVP